MRDIEHVLLPNARHSRLTRHADRVPVRAGEFQNYLSFWYMLLLLQQFSAHSLATVYFIRRHCTERLYHTHAGGQRKRWPQFVISYWNGISHFTRSYVSLLPSLPFTFHFAHTSWPIYICRVLYKFSSPLFSYFDFDLFSIDDYLIGRYAIFPKMIDLHYCRLISLQLRLSFDARGTYFDYWCFLQYCADYWLLAFRVRDDKLISRATFIVLSYYCCHEIPVLTAPLLPVLYIVAA